MAGRFISFEGGEGSGKTTQARLLAMHLVELGIPAELTREPGGTPGAEAIRTLLLDPPGDGWGPRAEALLFAAARADHVARLIRPQVASGSWVICDRFVDSSRAYQGGAGGIGDDEVLALHRFGSEALLPDRTILIDVPAHVVARRLAARDQGAADAIGGRDEAYHNAVRATFRRLAEAEPERFVVIDGDSDAETVQARVLAALAPLLDAAR